jgi:hypothetical protein
MFQGGRVECLGLVYIVMYVINVMHVYLTLLSSLHCRAAANLKPFMDTNTREFSDKLDSLHRRMDKFYEWASILQKEFRDMKQRQVFIESQCEMDFRPDKTHESSLQERLEKIKTCSITIVAAHPPASIAAGQHQVARSSSPI